MRGRLCEVCFPSTAEISLARQFRAKSQFSLRGRMLCNFGRRLLLLL
jgi:hypothetical protein